MTRSHTKHRDRLIMAAIAFMSIRVLLGVVEYGRCMFAGRSCAVERNEVGGDTVALFIVLRLLPRDEEDDAKEIARKEPPIE